MPRLFGGKGGLGKGPRLEVGQDVAVILWIAGPGVGADLRKGEVSFPTGNSSAPTPR